MEKKKSYLSDRLYKMIYNPTLPVNWKKLPDYKKIKMFHILFLLLNDDFQMKFGEELNEWISIYSNIIISLKEGKEYTLHPWLSIKKYKDEIGVKKCMECAKNNKNLCAMIFPYTDHIHLLTRESSFENLHQGIMRLYDENYSEDSVADPVYEFNSLPKDDLLSIAIKNFTEYFNSFLEGNISKNIYPEVKIYFPKEKLLHDFEKFIDYKQKLFFKKHPEYKSILFGHFTKCKADGRTKTYPFDEWERYFKVYVFQAQGKKQREIAEIFFHNNYIGSGESKISQDIRKAKRLIENAWKDDFPGKYS